jgi:PAS domain S-box-containing protein/putative nucleotidyltransferase with HDIG domain
MAQSESIRILYIEDDPGLARLVQKRLGKVGYTVDIASDGEEGIKKYEANSYDLMFVDQSLPVHDGLEVIRILGSNGSLPPTVMITGTGDERVAVEAMKLGAGDYIVKDVEGGYLELLPSVVEKVLQQRRAVEEKQQAEKELRESEQRYRTLVDNIDLGINLIGVDHTIVMSNAAKAKHFSRSVSDLIGKKCFREFAKRDTVCPHCPGNRAMATGQSAEVETEGIGDDGSPYHVRIQAFPFFGDDGTVTGFIEIAENITERKRSEEVLRHSEERYRTLVENIDFGINLIDADHTIVMVNTALSRRLNKKAGDFIGKKCFREFEKRDAVCPHCPGVRAMATGQPAEVETEGVEDDQDLFPARLQAFPILQKDGTAFGFIEVIEDITERKQAEKALMEHKEALKDSFFGTAEALSKVIEDRDPYTSGHSVGVAGLAEAIARVMGFSEEAITGIYIAGVLHDIGKMAVPVEILVKPGRLTDMEMSLIKIHPQAGYEILKGIDFPWPVAQATLQHHERMDGSGYPQGLKGDKIILEARILAVADVVDAMTHHRPYRPAFSVQDTMDELNKGRRKFYDQQVVDACLEVLEGKEAFTNSVYSTSSTLPQFRRGSMKSSVLPTTTMIRSSRRR